MRIKLTVSYDGTDFCGWQKQKNGVSVQETLETALKTLTGENIKVTGSGRTDAGVHAAGQVAHFDTESPIPPEKFCKALNCILPDAVKVIKSEKADENFNAVKSAKVKTYAYHIYISDVVLPLKERFAAMVPYRLDVKKMEKVANAIVGTHDFKCFSATGGSVKTTVRTVYSIDILRNGSDIEILVSGNGFLYNTVRIIAGTLIAAGCDKLSEKDVLSAFLSQNRKLLGKTMPAKGLCLKYVKYE